MAAKRGQRGKRTAEQLAKEKLALPPRERLMRMSHPLRYQLLTHLNDREWSPNELSDQLAESLSQVSYHVKVPLEYGLIELVFRSAQGREGKKPPQQGSSQLLQTRDRRDVRHIFCVLRRLP